MHKSLLPIFCLLFSLQAKVYAQGITLKPKKPSASVIYEDIKKLNFLGSVLYVAAHPDDENTTAISYFANTVKARTAYLSLTRGDGGQNLIGAQLRELLGVIRTQELLAARKTDGGEQRFTRANDFGYSKHPDETLAIWNKDEVLSDVVWAMRTFKPDVIINRFDHRTPGQTHGHHTSSAMLSVEAFDLVNDPSKYADQLQYTEVWQPKRQFFNTSWFFYGSREDFEKADKSNLVKIDIGTYYPSHGLSNTEISALSRSQHKSQGFGNTGSRGTSDTYLELLRGDYPKSGNIFEGIDTSWNRVKGGGPIGDILKKVEEQFDFKNPAASLPDLMKAYSMIVQLEDQHWKSIKIKDIEAIIQACAGLYLEASTNTAQATYGTDVNVRLEGINRSATAIQLKKVTLLPYNTTIAIGEGLENNVRWNGNGTMTIPNDAATTSAYWLNEKGTLGMYNVADRRLIGQPETPINHWAQFDLTIAGQNISIKKPIRYKYNDRVKGEVYQPFEIVPEASVALKDKVLLFSKAEVKTVSVKVTAHRDNVEGTVQLKHDADWIVNPISIPVKIAKKGQEKTVRFEVGARSNATEAYITPEVTLNGKNYSKELVTLDYDHIPLQSLFLPSAAKVVHLDIAKAGQRIGYIQGAGDAIPENLEQIGYTVITLDPATLTADELAPLDAVVIGIRAYNTVDVLPNKQPLLLDYVKKGGTMIVQYNTSGRRSAIPINPPYPLTLSRDRVTDENSEVTILAKDHQLLNYPNKITQADFDGWTQERGLYFPNKWDPAYTPLLAMNDKGETAKKGSLLVASYGHGHYIYTGLSFFRELPAGVAGAYRLFANMLSIGKVDEPTGKIKG